MIESMRSYIIFCIFDDIVMVAGSVIINIMSCYRNYFLDVTCLFKKFKYLVNHYYLLSILIILACTPFG